MTLRRVPVFAYDWVLVGLVLLINLIGLVTLYSAAPSQGVWLQQMLAFPIALSVGLLVQLFSRRQVLSWAFPLYAVSLVLLVLVLLVGREINGAKAWFNLGPLSFQPLELAKIGLILVLAKVLAARPLERWLDYALPVLLAAPVLGLVLIQPDLGGTLVLIAGLLGMLFVRGMPTIHIVVGLLAVLVLVPTVVWPNLSQYQRDRVEILFDLSKDPKGKGFQQIQSTIAIGSGGLMGKGFGAGTQTQLGFVPERQTDFIYAVLAEEWGFVGASTLMVLYALLFFRLGRMALECVRLEDRLIIVGVLSMLAFQVVVNIAVTLGLAPVTGLTLPLVSKGGSSLIMVYLGLGLALLIHRDRYSEV
ncbi:rod shape-determining protein RodA [Meiothermus taiwanensis]|uniref:Peptidoglycan glycosyltransferase MrdB n=2 Tax=Meiothermus taiwanensis TaxID=172827 RepID=A0A399DW82_9DEIN|nr:rod shape-determining protein RodA [Meiothermus taiwanensis]AWR86292.1 rod shape-determining protein RodA [Meiothermus taiwanensis WR-220]KIQ53610.1 rod shape-determining protein RodA [Meiothermus taiwanensis]RIH75478.1 Peptidoglycan glycosyltransferase MrdB [Meiothermus taiwanensis]